MIGAIRPQNYYRILDSRKNIAKDTTYEVVTRINDSCNLQCTYCHWNRGLHYGLDLWHLVHDKFFRALKELGHSILLAIHGGEAYTHPEFDKFVRILETMKVKYDLVVDYMTNNTFLTCPDIFDVLDVTLHATELYNHRLIDRFFHNLDTYKDKINNVDIMLEYVFDEKLYEQIVTSVCEWCIQHNKNLMLTYGYCHCSYSPMEQELNRALYETYRDYISLRFDIDGTIYEYSDLFILGVNCLDLECDALRKICYVRDKYLYACGIHMTSHLKVETGMKNCQYYHTPFLNLQEASLERIKSFLLVYKRFRFKCKWTYCGGDFEVQKYL
jgi:hypothetical protein